MVYKSQIDKEAYIISIVTLLLSIMLRIFDNTINLANVWIVMLLIFFLVLFVLVNILTTRYILTESELIVKTCMLRTNWKISKIVNIKKIKGRYSLSNLSMYQLEISYADNEKLRVSPKEMDEFEENLREKISMCK